MHLKKAKKGSEENSQTFIHPVAGTLSGAKKLRVLSISISLASSYLKSKGKERWENWPS